MSKLFQDAIKELRERGTLTQAQEVKLITSTGGGFNFMNLMEDRKFADATQGFNEGQRQTIVDAINIDRRIRERRRSREFKSATQDLEPIRTPQEIEPTTVREIGPAEVKTVVERAAREAIGGLPQSQLTIDESKINEILDAFQNQIREVQNELKEGAGDIKDALQELKQNVDRVGPETKLNPRLVEEFKETTNNLITNRIVNAVLNKVATAASPAVRAMIKLIGEGLKIIITKTITMRGINRIYGTLNRRGQGYTLGAILNAVAEDRNLSPSAAAMDMVVNFVLGSIYVGMTTKYLTEAGDIIYRYLYPPKGDRTTDVEVVEVHSPPWGNYNGPGTNVERRLKLLLPKKKVAGKVETGSASYIFPINFQDMVAFEHDLLYATDDVLIRQLADLRYLNYNFKNRGAFIKRVKDLGIDLPDDLKLNPVLVSSAAIGSQAFARSLGGWTKVIQDVLIKYAGGGSLFDPSISIKTGQPQDALTMIQLGLSRDNPVLAKKVAAEYGLDVEAVKSFIEGRTDKLDIPKYNKFINAAEETSDKMFKMMNRYGKFDNKGRYTVDKIDTDQFKGDLTDLYKDFNVMTDEQFKADGYRGYNRLPDAPAKENLDVFNKRIEKVIASNIATEKPEQRIEQQIFTDDMAVTPARVPLGIRGLIDQIQDRDQYKKEIFVREYRKELESRRLPVPSESDLGKFKTPEDQYDELTRYAWKESNIKDGNTFAAIAGAEDSIDDKVIKFLKTRIDSEKTLGKIEAREEREALRVLDGEIQYDKQVYREGKKPVREVVGGKRVAAKNNVGKDVEVEVPVGPSKAATMSMTPADNVLNASKSAIKEQPKIKAAKTTSETSATIKPAATTVAPEGKGVLAGVKDILSRAAEAISGIPDPDAEREKVIKEERAAEAKAATAAPTATAPTVDPSKPTLAAPTAAPDTVPMPPGVTEEVVVLPKPKKEPVGLPTGGALRRGIPTQKEAVELMQEGKVEMRTKPEGKAPDNLVETAVNPIDRIVDKLMTKSSKEERDEIRALIAFITPPDQTGGLGTVRTNPLVRDNAKHEKKVVVGEGDLYKDTVKNHLLANTSNLAMLQQFDKTTVDSRMKERREAPRRFTSLVRQVPDILTTQRQAKAESRDFIDNVNPSSAYAHGSQYGSYFQPVGRAGNYLDDRDLTRYWGNPSTSFTPVRYQNP